MKASLRETILKSFIAPVLERRLRSGSIKAVKAYIQTIKVARLALMGLFGIGAFSAILVSGICMMIFGAIGLLPISPQAVALTILIVGAVLTLTTGIGLLLILNQRRWLEGSRAYDMMEAVMAPWPDSIPPNPKAVFMGQGPKYFGSVSVDAGGSTHNETLRSVTAPTHVAPLTPEPLMPEAQASAQTPSRNEGYMPSRESRRDELVPQMVP